MFACAALRAILMQQRVAIMDRRHFLTTLAASGAALFPGASLATPGSAPHFARGRIRLRGEPALLIWKLQDTLDRQAAFVSRNCGPLGLDDLPIFIATTIDEDRSVRRAISDTCSYVTRKNGFWAGAMLTRTADIFVWQDASLRSGALVLLTAWPFTKATHHA